jgi:hypothetical protein
MTNWILVITMATAGGITNIPGFQNETYCITAAQDVLKKAAINTRAFCIKQN